MAVDEQIFIATRLAISPEALPVNTLPKKIRWKHLDGSFTLILSTVSSKIRLQLKQNGKPIITTTLNKLTPGQKKNLSAPRLQYQDQRMSFRYPSSSQLSERFQLTLDEIASVQTVVQKLTPFFAIIAPSNPAASSQSISGSQIGKKRGAKEIGEYSAGSAGPSANKRRATAAPRPELAESQAPVESQELPDSAGPPSTRSDAKVSVTYMSVVQPSSTNTSIPPGNLLQAGETSKGKEEPPAETSSTSPSTEQPQYETGLASFKASLLQGYTTPTPQTQDSQTQGATPNVSSSLVASFPPTSSPAPPYSGGTRLSDTQLSTQAPHTQPIPQSSSSTDLVSQEIDLLPRSPLVDTSFPPCLPARMSSLQQETLSSLIGLVFDGDEKQLEGLQVAFPPMRTAQEEQEDRRRRDMEEEEWKEGLGDQATEVDIYATRVIPTICQPEEGVLDLFALDQLAPRVAFTNEELYSAIDKGQISYEMLEMCYRITAVSSQYQRQQQYSQHADVTYHWDNTPARQTLQVGSNNDQRTFGPSSLRSSLSSLPPWGHMMPSSSPTQAGYRIDQVRSSSPPLPNLLDHRVPSQPSHQPFHRSFPSHDPSQPHQAVQHQDYGYTDYQQDTPADPSLTARRTGFQDQTYNHEHEPQYNYHNSYNDQLPIYDGVEVIEEIDDIDD